MSTEGSFNNRANFILLFFMRFLFLTTEAGFALARFPAHLTKTFSLAEARPLRASETPKKSGLRNAIARRRMWMRVEGGRSFARLVNLASVFPLEIGQHANGASPDWRARPSP